MIPSSLATCTYVTYCTVHSVAHLNYYPRKCTITGGGYFRTVWLLTEVQYLYFRTLVPSTSVLRTARAGRQKSPGEQDRQLRDIHKELLLSSLFWPHILIFIESR